MMTFESRILKGIFEPIGKEITRWWRKLQNEELHNLQTLLRRLLLG
jgi:hypothetical protein